MSTVSHGSSGPTVSQKAQTSIQTLTHGSKLDLDADTGLARMRADHYARAAQRHALVEYEKPEDAARAVRALSDASNWWLPGPSLDSIYRPVRTPDLQSVTGALLR